MRPAYIPKKARQLSVGSDNKLYGCSKDGRFGVAKTVLGDPKDSLEQFLENIVGFERAERRGRGWHAREVEEEAGTT